MLRHRQGGDVSDSVGLLISILVRYPEVGTVKYDSAGKHLRFIFLLKELLPPAEVTGLLAALRESLLVYNRLEGRGSAAIRVTYKDAEFHGMIELVRDVASLSLGEINLFVELLRQKIPALVLAEEYDPLQEEEQIFQEEMIGHMLESLRVNGLDKGLVAYREEGQVYVFNK